MVAGKIGQKKLICEHSSNEVSLAAAFVRTLTMVRVIWIPLRRAKWPTIVRGEHTGSEVSLSPQCGRSNYDIIFLQDFSKSSHFTQRAWNWAGVRWRNLRCWRVSGFHNSFPKNPIWEFLCCLNRLEQTFASSCILTKASVCTLMEGLNVCIWFLIDQERRLLLYGKMIRGWNIFTELQLSSVVDCFCFCWTESGHFIFFPQNVYFITTWDWLHK